MHRKSTIHNEKILVRKSWIAPKITTKAVSIVFIIIMDVLEAEHEKKDNFELQLRERKHTFEGIIVSTGKNGVCFGQKMTKPSSQRPDMTKPYRETVQASVLIVP